MSKQKNQLFLSLLLLGFLFAPGVASVLDGVEPDPVVKILLPISGWSGDRIITLEAEVTNPDIHFAHLIENGTQRMVRVKEGHVFEKLVLSPGSNQIILQVKHPKTDAIYSDHVVLYSAVPKKDIKVILTWDTDGTDVDLHVVNPAGVHCYFGNTETPEGGKLDVDITDGYGPEIFTQSNADRGQYEIKVHYYSSHGNPQTVAKVQVILFEGLDMEKKYNFEKVLVRTDDTFQVGTFDIEQLENEK